MVRRSLRTGSWRTRLRWVVRLLTPWGLEWWLHILSLRKLERARDEHQRKITPASDPQLDDAIRFLVARGLDEETVRFGSMPAISLTFMSRVIGPRLPRDRPVRALHVGNFVGVSLCYLTSLVRDQNPASVVLSVDPNTVHRGVGSPQSHVLALLNHYGLLSNSLIIPGYTLEQSFGELGAPDESDLSRGLACVDVLGSLPALRLAPFDLVLLDGNHDRAYLEREFVALRQLVAGGSIVVFDDVVAWEWDGVREVFQRVLGEDHCTDLGRDGRLGILEVGTAQ
jgi:hypothetical protein